MSFVMDDRDVGGKAAVSCILETKRIHIYVIRVHPCTLQRIGRLMGRNDRAVSIHQYICMLLYSLFNTFFVTVSCAVLFPKSVAVRDPLLLLSNPTSHVLV